MKKNFNNIFIRSYRKSVKFNLDLSSDLEDIIIGLMLGDLFAEKKNSNSNTRLQFKQSNENKEYIDHLYEVFKEYCGSKPKVISYFDSRPTKNKGGAGILFYKIFNFKFTGSALARSPAPASRLRRPLVLISLEHCFTIL